MTKRFICAGPTGPVFQFDQSEMLEAAAAFDKVAAEFASRFGAHCVLAGLYLSQLRMAETIKIDTPTSEALCMAAELEMSGAIAQEAGKA